MEYDYVVERIPTRGSGGDAIQAAIQNPNRDDELVNVIVQFDEVIVIWRKPSRPKTERRG